MIKEYVRVVVDWNIDGTITPLYLGYKQKKYKIEHIEDRKKAKSIVGGYGLRFCCNILGENILLFYEEITGCWFLEKDKDVYGFEKKPQT